MRAVPNEGLFKIQAYPTQKAWEEGGAIVQDAASSTCTVLSDAIIQAHAGRYASCYEVTVVACKDCIESKAGDVVYSRFKRPLPSLSYVPQSM